MSILDKLKLKKKPVPKKKSPVKKKAKEKVIAAPSSVKQPTKEGFSETVIKCLVAPHITEKATDLSEKRKYIFKVKKQANKTEIKKAIKQLYGVQVIDVKIINVPKKPRRIGRIEGYRTGYKKAIVTLGEGEKIEVIPK